MKSNAENWQILSRKHVLARNAAEYCRVRAEVSRDETVRKIYTAVAYEAEAEADKISKLADMYFSRYWQERYGDASGQEVWNDFVHRRGQFATNA